MMRMGNDWKLEMKRGIEIGICRVQRGDGMGERGCFFSVFF